MAEKKNVTLEVRLPDVTKSAFMAQCRQQDQTASEAIRLFIDGQLKSRSSAPQRSVWRVVLAWAFGLTLGAGIAAPSLARSEHNDTRSFAQLDRNHDGLLTKSEFHTR